ncbi:hypothetical protein JTB14_034856 [Gonioctena quinquepunctata]|nr:hypothetical protein JTB14_034856 [Gonioctena quinquepunctata]
MRGRMLLVIAPKEIFVFEISHLPISKSRTPAFNSIEIITGSPFNEDFEDNQRKKMALSKTVENMFSTLEPVLKEEHLNLMRKCPLCYRVYEGNRNPKTKVAFVLFFYLYT